MSSSTPSMALSEHTAPAIVNRKDTLTSPIFIAQKVYRHDTIPRMAKTPEDQKPPASPAAVAPEQEEAPENIRGFASLRFPDFRLLWVTAPISSAGQSMRAFANAYQVYQITGSTRALGLTFLFQAIPSLVFSMFGGTLADIFDRKKLININQVFQVGVALLLGFLTLTGVIKVWHIYIITFFAACMGQLELPARQAIIPSIVPRAYLLNASTLNLTTQRISQLFGPTLAGFMVGSVGPSAAYFFNAVLILPAVIVISRVKLVEAPRRPIKLNFGVIFEGLRFAITTQVLIAILLLDFVAQTTGYYQAMAPAIAKDILGQGPFGLGLLISAPAFGSLVGFVSLLMIGNVKRKGLITILSVLAWCILLAIFARSHVFIFSLGLAGLLGFVDSIQMAIRQTTLQLLAPNEKRGRVMAVNSILSGSANSLGGAYMGFLASFIGIPNALTTGAIIGGSMALGYLLFWKKVRDFTG
ncbi:MAG: MFS transporter [Dehalococcoidia bacterium]|nr:MFS transporter [Dehalococcoidia bacterium]